MRNLSVGVFALIVLQAACSDQLPVGTRQAGEKMRNRTVAEVPARVTDPASTFSRMSDDSLWLRIQEAGGTAVVGLRTVGKARGFYQGEVLLDSREIQGAVRAVLLRGGVEVVKRDTLLPIINIKMRDVAVLKRLRGNEFVDYVEPMLGTEVFRAADGFGCTEDSWTGNTTWSPSGDIVPAIYERMQIRTAWNRSSGRNVNIGLVDTGIFQDSDQLSPSGFSGGASAGRSISYLHTSTFDSPFANCSHGTRMAGIIAAPRDGHGPIGVAWGANLMSVRHNDDVFAGVFGHEARDGIRKAAEGNHIIVMAWGTADGYDAVSDEIRYWTYNPALPRLFIGAAGTQQNCATVGTNWFEFTPPPVLFPALMEEVIAVTAVDGEGALACDAHGGSAVDLAAYYNYPTAGHYGAVLGMRGSSSATATVAGAAALVWSRYGGGAADTRRRLYESAARYPSRAKYTGYGVIRVMQALGGLTGVAINGCSGTQCSFLYKQTACEAHDYYLSSTGGDGPFEYRWSNGDTNWFTSVETCPVDGQAAESGITGTVKDLSDGTSVSQSVRVTVVNPEAPCPTCRQ